MNALTPRNPETPQNSLYGALRGRKAISAMVVRRFIVCPKNAVEVCWAACTICCIDVLFGSGVGISTRWCNGSLAWTSDKRAGFYEAGILACICLLFWMVNCQSRVDGARIALGSAPRRKAVLSATGMRWLAVFCKSVASHRTASTSTHQFPAKCQMYVTSSVTRNVSL